MSFIVLLLLHFNPIFTINSVYGEDSTNLKKLNFYSSDSNFVDNNTYINNNVDRGSFKHHDVNSYRTFNDELSVSSSPKDLMNYASISYESSINPDSVDFHINRANALFAEVNENNRFVDYLTLGQSFQLPVGVQKSIGGLSYTVVFNQISLTNEKAYIDAYLVIELPSERRLTFMGRDIEFSVDGGIKGLGRVELLGNNNITFSGDEESQNILFTLFGGDPVNPGNTYAEFDCYGFRELSIDAGVTFSKKFIVKENADGSLSDDRVTSRFTTKVSDWNDIIVAVDLPKFQMANLKDWSFEVTEAVFDFSDSRNLSSIVFPPDYSSPLFLEEGNTNWRGFYLRELVITMPEAYNKRNQSGRTSFSANNLIIDELGLTGIINAQNILGINEGNADSWKMSVNNINLEIIRNELSAGNINGQIEVPSLETEDPLLYSGTFTENGNYDLIARLQSTAEFDVFKADLNLASNSLIELKVIDGMFKPRAVLHGNMDVKPTNDSGKNGAEVNGLLFQSLVLQTEAPFIDAQYFGFEQNSQNNKAGGFSIGIEKVAIQTEPDQNRVGILVDMNVNLVNANDNGFGAKSSLAIWAKQSSIENEIRYEYDELDLRGIAIDVTRNGFSFKGNLKFYEGDNTYGDGFRGSVLANFGSSDKAVEVQATALFGAVDGFRYWYVDAFVEWKNGFPVVSPFALNGFGGGAYYHMRQQGLNENIGNDLSRSNSGIVYIPDNSVYLGLKASVIFSIQNAESTANGKAEFGISFNQRGGVNQISFDGSVEMMTQEFISDLDIVKEAASQVASQEAIRSKPSSAFRGDVKLLFDNSNKSFHGIIDVYINAAGGVITGSNPNYLAGRSIIHFEPNYWYIHIGKPSNPIGLQFLGLAKANSYFMIGDDIPGIPPPPQLVLDILTDEQRIRNEEIRAEGRNLAGFSSNRGFAFGANFNLETGEKKHLAIFYGRFAATAGFDINMSKFNASCGNQNDLVGINGWYAQGQAYVGLLATIGMDINLKFINKRVEIFYGELAALMQIKGPNPFWLRGDASGTFSVLNGLVEGSFDFELEIGEECELNSEGSPLEDINIIAELTPEDETDEVDVFTTPQAVFNIPVEKEFELSDLDGNPISYRVKLDYFRLKDGNNSLEADISFNEEKKVFVLDPVRVLPSEAELELEVEIHFEEYKNGIWTTYEEDNDVVTENLKYKFTTGLQPDYIPKDMVEYSYPIEGMTNFYQAESQKGYIKLNDLGLIRPFEKEGRWDLKASFTAENGDSVKTDFTYNEDLGEVSFDIPQLSNDKIYHFQLLRVPSQENALADSNVETVRNTLNQTPDGQNIDLEIQTMEAEGSIEALAEEEIYSFYIRTSKYNSLEEKLFSEDYKIRSGTRQTIREGVHMLTMDISNGKEQFDHFEINGTHNIPPLIQLEAAFTDNNWYQNHLGPLLYEGYPYFENGQVTNTESKIYGVPPVEAFYFNQNDNYINLNQEEEFSQSLYQQANDFSIKYIAADYVEKQYAELRNKASSYYRNKSKPDRVQNLLNSVFPIIRKGLYGTNFKYVLPGGRTGLSDFDLSFYSNVGQVE
ncbi:hypothetical protein [Marivirga sp.]|uniref:hypothetical protein n=1 Tax=Marivirga sp. TaxID=2018662 RepID=UPI002D7F2AF9|nr:hypothetical protein [Marivirga sp.]HET8858818.1 hypothetical protein [Marivirga sp.]